MISHFNKVLLDLVKIDATLLQILGNSGSMDKESVDYTIRGKVSLSEGFVRSIPFEERGTFRMK